MARLHEYQGKEILADHGIAVPRGQVARSAEEAGEAARAIGGPVILKVQAWVTGRKDKGGVIFADDADAAERAAAKLLEMRFGNFPVAEVLVEQQINIAHELFVSLTIDDAAQQPLLLLDCTGGTGIEERAATIAKIPVSLQGGPDRAAIERALADAPFSAALRSAVAECIERLCTIARTIEARSFEVNPLVITADDRIVAADCRITIDDYAVFRHPELGIEIARELDHPATELERIAYAVEQEDHRGTFYFAQLPTDHAADTRGIIGFHGAGGGGSMMSMDAVSNLPGGGFTLANFCDTSGNPSAAKVYRAARIILAQPNLVGYFGSGSGVASQEQFWSAYGLAKAFNEVNLNIPAVIRLGGNSEDRAVDILQDACRDLPAAVEGYKKDDTPRFCAERFAELVAAAQGQKSALQDGHHHDNERNGRGFARHVPSFVGTVGAYQFPITGGAVWIDHDDCDEAITQFIVERSSGLLKVSATSGHPVLAVSKEEAASKDSEFIALEIECLRARHAAAPVVFVDLPLAGIDTPHRSAAHVHA